MHRSAPCRTAALIAIAITMLLPAVAGAQWTNWRLNDDTTNELQNEQQVVVNPTDPSNLVAAWCDFRLGYPQVGWGYTHNGGSTWTNPGLFVDPHYPRDSGPALTVNAAGHFFATLLAYTGVTSEPNGMLMYRSTDGGHSWEDRGFAIDGGPGGFEAEEFIACDRISSLFRGSIYMAWTRYGDDGSYIYCVNTRNDGATWSSEVLVSDERGQSPMPAVDPDGTVYVAWTSDSGIRIDRSFGGLGFGADIDVTSVYSARPNLNGGISTPAHPALDVDISGGPYDGRLYIAYMSKENFGDYDIFICHSDDRAQTWSSSRRINDDAFGNGRDQFHVWLTVDNLGTVSVVWLDRRHDPQNLAWHCYVSQSTDGGLNWSANQQVSTVESHPSQMLAEPDGDGGGGDGGPRPDEARSFGGVIGEYIGIACWDGFITPIWVDTRNGHQDTYGGALVMTPVDDAGARTVLRMRISPNPSGGPFTVNFAVPRDGRVSLELFDVAGRRVRTLVDRNLREGEHRCVWDGRDQAGRRVPTGTYLARLRTVEGQESRRVTVAR